MITLTPYEPAARMRDRDEPHASPDATHPRAACVRRGALETALARIDLAAASSRGKRRRLNEDAFSELDRGVPLYVVADGVGGGALASRASRELVDRVHGALDGTLIDAGAVRNALLIADREIARSIASRTHAVGAATVALCAGLDPSLSRWLVAWVGDCRVYRIVSRGSCGGELLTLDDTYRHLAETPPAGGSADDPARMVGNGAIGTPNVVEIALGDDEMLVLCSDGVHKPLAAVDLARLLRDAAVPLVRRCTRLVALARARGGSDDATVLVVHRRALTPVPPASTAEAW